MYSKSGKARKKETKLTCRYHISCNHRILILGITLKNSATWDYYKSRRSLVNVAVIREKKPYLNYKIKKSGNSIFGELTSLGLSAKKFKSNLSENISDPDDLNNYFLLTQIKTLHQTYIY